MRLLLSKQAAVTQRQPRFQRQRLQKQLIRIVQRLAGAAAQEQRAQRLVVRRAQEDAAEPVDGVPGGEGRQRMAFVYAAGKKSRLVGRPTQVADDFTNGIALAAGGGDLPTAVPLFRQQNQAKNHIRHRLRAVQNGRQRLFQIQRAFAQTHKKGVERRRARCCAYHFAAQFFLAAQQFAEQNHQPAHQQRDNQLSSNHRRRQRAPHRRRGEQGGGDLQRADGRRPGQRRLPTE